MDWFNPQQSSATMVLTKNESRCDLVGEPATSVRTSMSLTIQQFLKLREDQNQRLQRLIDQERERERKRVEQEQLWQQVYQYVIAEAARSQQPPGVPSIGTSNGIIYRCKWGNSCFLSHCAWIHPVQSEYHQARWYQSTIPCRVEAETHTCPLQFPSETGRYCPFSHINQPCMQR